MSEEQIAKAKELVESYYGLLYPKQYSDEEYRMFFYDAIERLMKIFGNDIPDNSLKFANND